MPEQRRCILGRPLCNDRTACAAHQAWKKTAAGVAAFFRDTSVADLLERTGSGARI